MDVDTMSEDYGVTLFFKKKDFSQKEQVAYLQQLLSENHTFFLDKDETHEQVISRFATNDEDVIMVDNYGPSISKSNIGSTNTWMDLCLELSEGNFTESQCYDFLRFWYFPFAVKTWQMLGNKLAFGATIENYEYVDKSSEDPIDYVSGNWLIFLHSREELSQLNIHTYDTIISIPEGIIVVNDKFKPATHLNTNQIFSFTVNSDDQAALDLYQKTMLSLDRRLRETTKQLIQQQKILRAGMTVRWPGPNLEHNPFAKGTVLVLLQAVSRTNSKLIETEIKIAFDKKKNTFAMSDSQLTNTIYNALMKKNTEGNNHE